MQNHTVGAVNSHDDDDDDGTSCSYHHRRRDKKKTENRERRGTLILPAEDTALGEFEAIPATIPGEKNEPQKSKRKAEPKLQPTETRMQGEITSLVQIGKGAMLMQRQQGTGEEDSDYGDIQSSVYIEELQSRREGREGDKGGYLQWTISILIL